MAEEQKLIKWVAKTTVPLGGQGILKFYNKTAKKEIFSSLWIWTFFKAVREKILKKKFLIKSWYFIESKS